MPRPRQRPQPYGHALLASSLVLLSFLLTLAQAWTPLPPGPAPTTRQGAVLNHLAQASSLLGFLSLPPLLPALALDAEQNPSPAAVFILAGYRIPSDQYSSYQRRLLTEIPSLSADSVTLLPDRQGEADEVDNILHQLQQGMTSRQRKNKKKVVLIGHSRGASVTVRVAARLPSFSSRLDLCGLILLDPVDEKNKSSSASNSSSGSSSSSSSSSDASTSSSCLPLLRSLPPTLPIVILALPFSGVNAYYKSPNRNVCAPPGRDARAFYSAAGGAGRAGGRSLPVLLTLPSAGHLQLLDSRLSLPFAEMCGVGKTNTDQEIQSFVAAVVVACCEGWVGREGGREGGLRERIWRRLEEEGGVGAGMGGSVVWEGG